MGGWRGHTTGRPKDLENNASATASSALWFVRVIHWGRSDPLSPGWTDILLFLFKRAERESAPFNAHHTQCKQTDLVVFPDLTDDGIESLVDVDRLLG